MSSKDLCQDKKFPDLEDDFFITYDKKKRMSFIDEKNNVWMEGEKISEGGHGKVVDFISHNKEYTDLAVKFFISENRKDYLLDMEEESEAVNFFNMYRCKNFLKMGVKPINNEDNIIIMEKIDGDLFHFDFSKYRNPMKLYKEVVAFLVSAYQCALKRDKYYTDIKEENIGYKMCKNGPVFTFLDFGSFFDKNQSSVIATFNVNRKYFNEGKISNDLLVVFGTIMTLLSLRLSVIDRNLSKKFRNFVFDLADDDQYYSEDYGLLDYSYAQLIIEYFYELFNQEDMFVEDLLDILFNLTSVKITVKNLTDFLEFSNR